VYIGSSCTLSRRWTDHKKLLRRNKHYTIHLQRAWNIYGEKSFVFEVIERVPNKSNLLKREQYYIDFYKSYNKRHGYNCNPTAGSQLGFKHSKESKLKMSKSHSGKKHHYFGKSSPMLGRHHTDAAKEKIRRKAIGRGFTPEVILKLRGPKTAIHRKHLSEAAIRRHQREKERKLLCGDVLKNGC